MTRITDVMSRPVRTIGPQESLRRAAAMMRDHDVGALPVCHDLHLLGMVTDRDLVTRGTASGLTPDGGCVSDVMSPAPICCKPDQDVADVLRTMGERQLRRLPVVDREGRLVGIVALADLALATRGEQVGETVRRISQPSPVQDRLI